MLREADEEQQRKADEIARILLERHQRKVAKIEIVREYLQEPEAPQVPSQTKQTEQEHSQEETIKQDFNPEPEIDTSKRLLARYPVENATEPLKDSKRFSPVKQILDAVISMSNSTQPL